MGRPISAEHKRRISEANKGHSCSEETKRKISESKKGTHLSGEAKRKIGDALRGKKMPPRSEEYRLKMSETKKGTRLSEEHKKKIGDAGRGRKASEETKIKMSEVQKRRDPSTRPKGESHPFFGKHHTAEAIERMREAHLGKPNPNAGNRGKKKEAHPNWRGGRTPIRKSIRESIQYRDWRQQCFLRDNFTCQNCGTRGGRLNVHHEKSFIKLLKEAADLSPLLTIFDAAMAYAPFWDIDNGKTLCTYCHNVSKHRYKQEPSVIRMLNGDGRVKRHQSDETKLKLRLANLGKHPSKESRQKMSDVHKGQRPWNYGLTKETDERVGRSHEKLMMAVNA